MSINELRRRHRLFSERDCLRFLMVFLTFNLVKNFPMGENFTSSTSVVFTKIEDDLVREALVKSFNDSWNVEEFEEAIPTLPIVK